MKFRILLLSIVLWISYSGIAQRTIPPTDSIQIFGQVKNPTTFTLADLDTFPKTAIKDQVIYNHNGEIKDTLTDMSGIPIRSLLTSIQFEYDKPKVLNEFYFVFIASDGYKVVFSWNEIYNTETGNNFFIVTEMEGKKLKELDQRIVFISTADLKTGRRYIKGLAKIEVSRVE
ncbi:MAG: molybdopterin-binding protein [Flavobacteriales bacterium]